MIWRYGFIVAISQLLFVLLSLPIKYSTTFIYLLEVKCSEKNFFSYFEYNAMLSIAIIEFSVSSVS